MNTRLAALAALVLATGCQSFSAPDSVVYGTAVVTQYANGVTWGSYGTYMIDPTVVVVDGTGSVQTTCTVPAANMLPTITSQMSSRGYTAVTWDPNPASTVADLVIKLQAHLGNQTTYYGGGYCGWYPYYYCYPGWDYVSSYNFGTLELTMGDVKHATAGQKIPLVWNGVVYGILGGYYQGCAGNQNGTGINWAIVNEAVNRAFDQSPYIHK